MAAYEVRCTVVLSTILCLWENESATKSKSAFQGELTIEEKFSILWSSAEFSLRDDLPLISETDILGKKRQEAVSMHVHTIFFYLLENERFLNY